jgi:adenylyltransferase/sulfurtransferase
VLPGIIGVIQATEAIKLIVGIGEPLVGRDPVALRAALERAVEGRDVELRPAATSLEDVFIRFMETAEDNA